MIEETKLEASALAAAIEKLRERFTEEAERYREAARENESIAARHCQQRCAATIDWCAEKVLALLAGVPVPQKMERAHVGLMNRELTFQERRALEAALLAGVSGEGSENK